MLALPSWLASPTWPERPPLRGLHRPYAQPAHRASRVRASEVDGADFVATDPRLVSVSLDRVTGIDFGCDLTLRWPYVMGLVPNGAAERTGEVEVGDQLLAVAGESVVGGAIGDVMDQMAQVEGAEISLLFFRGTREQLKERVNYDSYVPTSVTITLLQSGKPPQCFEVPYGANLRDELISRGINVYQSITRWTNCNGKQLCGTCIVDVTSGIEQCTRRSIDEASTLRENPLTYKLACITNVYGNVTVQLTPKIGAAQWTR